MGNYISRSYRQLSAMTINYSGILLSPFEFYSAELNNHQTQLSNIFETIMKQQFPEYNKATFKWGLGKIDQKMQKERYTPIYDQNVGIENGKLLTFEEFNKLWDQRFDQNSPLVANLEFKPQEKARARIFDLLCYRTIIMYVYKTQDFEKINPKKIKPYQQFMQMFFSKLFLNEEKKIKYTIQAIDKGEIDVLFVQQANQNLIKAVNMKFGSDYLIVRSTKGQSLILLRTKRFKKIHNEKDILMNLGKQMIELLDWNNDTAIAFVDNLILFSGHLSSKKQKNIVQVAKMLESLQKMKRIYPNHHLIVGCDANTYLSKVPSFLNSFPDKENMSTTLKKRTFMQPQVNKANQLAEHCRDHLISDLQLQKSKVIGINGQDAKQIGFLPCQKHPYDHYIVASTILIKQD